MHTDRRTDTAHIYVGLTQACPKNSWQLARSPDEREYFT